MARWGKVDYKDFEKFQKKIEKMQGKDFDKFCESCAKALAARLLAKVIRLTPKRKNVYQSAKGEDRIVQNTSESGEQIFTKEKGKKYRFLVSNGGTLQRGWIAKTERDAEIGSGYPDAEKQKAFLEGIKITKNGDAYQIVIYNPVNYASYVEYGHVQTPGRYVPAIGKQLKKGWVGGRFMLTKAEAELETKMPGILEKMMKKYLMEAFDVN